MKSEITTIKDVRMKCVELVRAGRLDTVAHALREINVQKISQIPESEYQRFMKCLDPSL